MSVFGNLGKRSIRSVKNYAKGYSVTQTKVRNATSNDPWPATQRQLEEITQLSYRADDFEEIVEIVQRRLSDKGKNWRHVLKSLTLIEHLLQQGPERVVHYCKNHFHSIRTLKDFQYRDERGNDHGANVRQKAKDVANLLTNPSTLRHKRRARSVMDTSFLLSLGNTADTDDDENENIRRRDVALLRASFLDQDEDAPLRAARRPGGTSKGPVRPASSFVLGRDSAGESSSPSPDRKASTQPEKPTALIPGLDGDDNRNEAPVAGSAVLEHDNSLQMQYGGVPISSAPTLVPSMRPTRSATLGSYPSHLHTSNPFFSPIPTSDEVRSQTPNSVSLTDLAIGSPDLQFSESYHAAEDLVERKDSAPSPTLSQSSRTAGGLVLGSNNPFAKFL